MSLVSDTVCVAEHDWPHLRVMWIVLQLAGALQRDLTDGAIGDLS